jgi:hypothetical protein
MSHSRPEFRYYWVYYAGFNAPWVVVPIGRCRELSSTNHISSECLTLDTVILFQSVRRILAKEKALRDINGHLQSSRVLEWSQEAKKTR